MTKTYGHSYLLDSSPVLKDIQATIQKSVPPARRSLIAFFQVPDFGDRF
jgi:hypothetical protein